MEKYIAILILFSCIELHAQDTIPNANFEQSTYYTDAGNITHIHTNFWKQSDSTTIILYRQTAYVFVPFEGKYSANVYADYMNKPTYIYQRFPYSEKPKTLTLQAFFGHMSTKEKFCVEVVFEKNNNIISYNKSYSDFNYYNTYRDSNSFCYPYLQAVPIDFQTADTPDYCTIKIWSANCDSGGYHLPLNRVIVDDLKFHKEVVPSSKNVNTSIVQADQRKVQTKEKHPLKLVPNPAGQQVILTYSLKENDNIYISLFDSQGKLVRNILNQKQTLGEYSINIEILNLPEGIYYLTFRGNEVLSSNKLLILH